MSRDAIPHVLTKPRLVDSRPEDFHVLCPFPFGELRFDN